jgi:hypothetical protein
LAYRVAKFAAIQKGFDKKAGAVAITDELVSDFVVQLRRASCEFTLSGLPDGSRRMAEIGSEISAKHSLEAASLKTHAWNARREVIRQLRHRKFLRVADDCTRFVNRKRLFGIPVWTAFPSARDEIREIGNCLAAECHTAAVFHAMRAAEIALRALAYDRRAKIFKNATTMREISLDLATWDEIIRELEKAEDEIRNYPQCLAREEQFEFYHGAMMQFKRFKNVFRNRPMHTRESYGRGVAHDSVNQVREFMTILASKIKEGEQTPVIWV